MDVRAGVLDEVSSGSWRQSSRGFRDGHSIPSLFGVCPGPSNLLRNIFDTIGTKRYLLRQHFVRNYASPPRTHRSETSSATRFLNRNRIPHSRLIPRKHNTQISAPPLPRPSAFPMSTGMTRERTSPRSPRRIAQILSLRSSLP
jgi:hypothetical protein